MRREGKIGFSPEPVDPTLRFWFKGKQDRLIDEISGNTITINQNLMEWNSTKQAYLMKSPASYNPKYDAYCVCNLGITSLPITFVYDVYPKSSGTNIASMDTYPTRQAMGGFTYNKLFTNQWQRIAVIWQMTNSSTATCTRYTNGVLKVTNTYTSTGDFNSYQGVTLNYTNQWSGDWGTYYGKNFRWYNRVLTMDEIDSLDTTYPVPAGYTQLKSIGCTGVVSSNYILTDFKPQWNWTVRGSFSIYNNAGTGDNGVWICGTLNDYSSYRQCTVYFFTSNYGSGFGMDSVFGQYRSGAAVNYNYDTSTVFTFEAKYNHMIVKGSQTDYSSSQYGTTTPNSNFTLFRSDVNNASSRYNKHKLYWLSLSDSNDTLIHYFIPTMRNSDSKLGVYDVIGNTFYPVTGTQWNYETL